MPAWCWPGCWLQSYSTKVICLSTSFFNKFRDSLTCSEQGQLQASCSRSAWCTVISAASFLSKALPHLPALPQCPRLPGTLTANPVHISHKELSVSHLLHDQLYLIPDCGQAWAISDFWQGNRSHLILLDSQCTPEVHHWRLLSCSFHICLSRLPSPCEPP